MFAYQKSFIKRLQILFIFVAISAIFLFLPKKVLAAAITISSPSITNDEVTINVSVIDLSSSSCPNIKCFLQGMFTQSTSNPQYFGYTQNNFLTWYEYTGSPEQSYIQSTFFYFEPQQATWSGQLKVKNNPQDPDYKGPGDYFLRVRRYTGNSSSSTSETSNDLTVQLTYMLPTPIPTEEPEEDSTSESTPTPTPSPTPKPPTPTPTKKPTPTPKMTPTPTPTPGGEVLGEEIATPSATPTEAQTQEEEKQKRNWLPFILIGSGFLLLFGSAGFLLIPKLRKGGIIKNDESIT